MPRPFCCAAIFFIAALANTSNTICAELWSTPPAAGGRPFYNSDGTRIISTSQNYTHVIDTGSGRLVNTIRGAFAALPTGDPALVGLLQLDRSLEIVRLVDGAVLFTHQNVRDAAFLKNGALVYSQQEGQSPPIVVVDSVTGARLKEIGPDPNSKIRATGNRFIIEESSPSMPERNRFRIFNFENRELTSVTVTNAHLHDGVISESGDFVAAMAFQPERSLFVYDLKTMSVRWTRPLPIADWMARIAWVEGDRKILVHSGSTTLLDAATGEIVWDKAKGPGIADVAPDKNEFIAWDGFSTIYDIESGEPERIVDLGFGGGRTMVISPDGKFITYGNLNGQLLCRELATGKIVWGNIALDPTNSHNGVFRSVAGAPDGSFVMATRLAGPFSVDTYFMDAKTGDLLKTIRTDGLGNWELNEAAAPAASSDNKRLVVGNIDTVVIADIENGANLQAFRPETNVMVYGVAFVQNDRAVAVGLRNSRLKIYSVADGAELQTLSGGTYGLTVSHDRSLLAGIDTEPNGFEAKHVIVRRTSDLSTALTITPPKPPTAIGFVRGNGSLAVYGDGIITIWDMTGNLITQISAPDAGLRTGLVSAGNLVALTMWDSVKVYSGLSEFRGVLTEVGLKLDWRGMAGPYTIESAPSVNGPWTGDATAEGSSIDRPAELPQRFFRVRSD